MPFPFDEYPWAKFEDLNIAYMIHRLGLIISQAQAKLDELDAWKTATEQDLENWKNNTMDLIAEWEHDFMADVHQWENETEQDLAQWKIDTIASLDTWKATFITQYEALRVEVENIRDVANTSAQLAAQAATSASAAATRAENAASSIQGSAALIAENTDAISKLGSAITPYNRTDFIAFSDPESRTLSGITYDFLDDKSCHVYGTATAVGSSASYFMSSSEMPEWLTAGATYLLDYFSDKVLFQIWNYTGGALTKILETKRNAIITIPDTMTAAWVRLAVANGDTTDEIVHPRLFNISTISADTACYLAPDGTRDRTQDILTNLTEFGMCRLGPGDYYVKNLAMPAGSALIGSGRATHLILINDANSVYAVKLNSTCSIDRLCICGTSSITPTTPVREKSAILWEGTYDQDQSAPYRALCSTIWIYNIPGSGIKLRNTGYGGDFSAMFTDIYIWNCDAGINVDYWAEFNKFTNIRASACYYGLINNGGNNTFINCDFSSNRVGMLMDNENDQSPNNSHGSCIGCSFNHSNANNGVGIRMLNCDNGFMFEGCQIFYSRIEIINSDGAVFSACNFGSANNGISVQGGGAHLFTGCMFGSAPTISITGNDKTHFNNCYVRSTGAAVQ